MECIYWFRFIRATYVVIGAEKVQITFVKSLVLYSHVIFRNQLLHYGHFLDWSADHSKTGKLLSCWKMMSYWIYFQVCWNPNVGSHLWLLLAGHAGLIQSIQVSGLDTDNSTSVVTRAGKTGNISKNKVVKGATQAKDSNISGTSAEKVTRGQKVIFHIYA